MTQATKCALALAMLSSMSACAQQPKDSPATASDTATTSLCLIDRAIPVRPAPGANVDDPGNRFDTDETSDALLEHNARLRAACPTAPAD